MREPLVDVDGKQVEDVDGKLRWEGPPAELPSNALSPRQSRT